jgi:hypothetical protein
MREVELVMLAHWNSIDDMLKVLEVGRAKIPSLGDQCGHMKSTYNMTIDAVPLVFFVSQ